MSLFKRFNFASDEHASDPGGGATPAPPVAQDSGGVASATSSDARAAAIQAANVSPRKRGRPRADSGVSASVDPNAQAVHAAIAQQLQVLHDPKQWSALLSMPADAAKLVTGNERWELAERERDTLGLTGSAFAQTLMITNPRALAGLMLASALFSAYVPRTIAQLKDMREAQAAKEKAAKEKGAA